MKISGRVASNSPIPVVEYYHTGFGHYFMTADPDEIVGLDDGAYGGVFTRTGQVFYAATARCPGTADVCRFFTVTFAPKSSHFYTADPVECAGVKLNPDWHYEKIAYLHQGAGGRRVPVSTSPIYRAYNNGMTGAPNHRFTTEPRRSTTTSSPTAAGRREGIKFCACR